MAPEENRSALTKSAFVELDEFFGLDGELIPVLFKNRKTVSFDSFYAKIRSNSMKGTWDSIESNPKLLGVLENSKS